MIGGARAGIAAAMVLASALSGLAQEEQAQEGQSVTKGAGAVLRTLDKMEGATRDMELRSGETGTLNRMDITLRECRYPTDNPAGEAYAYLVIQDREAGTTEFEGWMLATSPALNPLDHPRYDVWVLRCTTP
ncbi:DUF2155 domain-containing protein [Sediminimonas qiaohouensis]|nr:DUF2155 domain-containing protein [Sediminimonas qiaohouensis]